MKQVNHRLIVLARESRELTQSALSRETGIAQGTLSKIEGGLLACPDDALASICKVVDYPADFFRSDVSVHGVGTEAHHCLYRRKAAVPAKTLKRIEAEVNVRRMHVSKLLASVDLDSDLQIPSLDPSTYEGDIERIAMTLRAYWNVPSGPIDDITELIERAGGIVIHHDFGTDKIDATSLRISGLPPLFFVNTALRGDRLRFTLAHELGHVVMHTVPHPKIEDEADRFAAEFLMPAADIGPSLVRLDLAKAARLKPFWKVSMAAIVYRAHQLGRITSNQYRYLFYQLSASGFRMAEPAELDIPIESPTVHGFMVDFFRNELGYTTDDIKNLFLTSDRDFSRFYRSTPAAGHLRAVQ